MSVCCSNRAVTSASTGLLSTVCRCQSVPAPAAAQPQEHRAGPSLALACLSGHRPLVATAVSKAHSPPLMQLLLSQVLPAALGLAVKARDAALSHRSHISPTAAQAHTLRGPSHSMPDQSSRGCECCSLTMTRLIGVLACKRYAHSACPRRTFYSWRMVRCSLFGCLAVWLSGCLAVWLSGCLVV